MTPKKEHIREYITVKEGLKTRRFYYIYLMAFCTNFYGSYIVAVYKILAEEVGIDDLTMTITGSLSAVVNASSKLGCGLLVDRFGFKFMYTFTVTI